MSGCVASPAGYAGEGSSTTSKQATQKHPWRFWAIIIALSLTGLLSTIEGTIITSALPTITKALGGSSAYIWVPNAYFLASLAILPLVAQASDIFGRRPLLLMAVALFVLGSGLCGGASSMRMLIAARTVQGLGGGAIALLINTVVTDLVPLRERGKYMALIQMTATIGAALGPFLGGLITDHSTWRWVFYLNIPIGGNLIRKTAAFVALFLFLRLNYERDQTWKQRLARLDIAGNAIFIAAIIAVLIALTWGGTIYDWGTYHIVVPIVLGFVGIGLFVTFEWTVSKEPSFPRSTVSNRTSIAALILCFTHSICVYWTFYFLPIYFQAVRGASAMRSGINTLPVFAGVLPFAILGGILLSKLGRYKPLHFLGFIPLTIAMGLFSLLTADSSTAAWVCFQLLCSVGAGLLSGITLPAMQAPLDESLVAVTTGVWSFARGFGSVWGVTIPSAIYNNECRKNARIITDPEIAHYLTGGRAYEYSTRAFLDSIQDPASREQVVQVFQKSLRTVWLVAIAFAGLGLLVTLVEKEVKLRDKLNTKFGLDEKGSDESSDKV
ncbi:major facilitator superfamily domain-containing protein [Aspergillus minisclerotigenes]|uniref:Major facilitator superfamily domain-containing protein n=1 Tax=Aspergillus minisclerotigenes TaxID=656917 RepID=A0A5N6JMS6_9EURO|nr:major facilitator superfamily domain-containing protein [Aspergillus minisclerotigenes]